MNEEIEQPGAFWLFKTRKTVKQCIQIFKNNTYESLNESILEEVMSIKLPRKLKKQLKKST